MKEWEWDHEALGYSDSQSIWMLNTNQSDWAWDNMMTLVNKTGLLHNLKTKLGTVCG